MATTTTTTPQFQPKTFYKLINPNLPNASLSAGIFQDTQGAINLTESGSLSSENWQLFYQAGRYFIRNYDYGAGYQLGLTESSRSTPKLYPRSGKVEQQWSIISVKGGFQIVNGLWGNGTTLNLPVNWALPAMGSGNGGETWTIEENQSAAAKKEWTAEWTSEVKDFEVLASPSPSASASASMTSAVVASTSISQTSQQVGVPTVGPPVALPSSPATSPTLSSGAIAGIAVGSVAVLGASILGIWFLLMRRKRRHGPSHYELPGEPRAVNELEKYAYRAELQQPAVELPGKRERAEMAGLGEGVVYRAELEGSLGKERDNR